MNYNTLCDSIIVKNLIHLIDTLVVAFFSLPYSLKNSFFISYNMVQMEAMMLWLCCCSSPKRHIIQQHQVSLKTNKNLFVLFHSLCIKWKSISTIDNSSNNSHLSSVFYSCSISIWSHLRMTFNWVWWATWLIYIAPKFLMPHPYLQ